MPAATAVPPTRMADLPWGGAGVGSGPGGGIRVAAGPRQDAARSPPHGGACSATISGAVGGPRAGQRPSLLTGKC